VYDSPNLYVSLLQIWCTFLIARWRRYVIGLPYGRIVGHCRKESYGLVLVERWPCTGLLKPRPHGQQCRSNIAECTSRTILSTKSNVASTKSNVASTLLPFWLQCRTTFSWNFVISSYSVFSFSIFFVSVTCARLSWPFRQLLSARKYIVSYRLFSLIQLVESIVRLVAFDNIASTLLLVWTRLYQACVALLLSMLRDNCAGSCETPFIESLIFHFYPLHSSALYDLTDAHNPDLFDVT